MLDFHHVLAKTPCFIQFEWKCVYSLNFLFPCQCSVRCCDVDYRLYSCELATKRNITCVKIPSSLSFPLMVNIIVSQQKISSYLEITETQGRCRCDLWCPDKVHRFVALFVSMPIKPYRSNKKTSQKLNQCCPLNMIVWDPSASHLFGVARATVAGELTYSTQRGGSHPQRNHCHNCTG